MFQQFHTDTLMGRFIKHLLSTTRIPLLDSVETNDLLYEGCLYLYKNMVIKCVESGYFYVNKRDNLYPSNNIYPSDYLFPSIGYTPARYMVIRYYDMSDDILSSYKFHSPQNYYDSDTHYHLGQYLRYVKGTSGVNMLPYYNCHIGKTIGDVLLHTADDEGRTYSEVSVNNDYKVYAVPIKFGRIYTIAIDCPTPISLRCVLYDRNGLMKNPKKISSGISDYLENTYLRLPSSVFTSPFTYRADIDRDVDAKLLYSRQRDLYLLIQVPQKNDSALAVLEGEYLSCDNRFSLISTSPPDFDMELVNSNSNAQSMDDVYIKKDNGRFFASNRYYNLSLLQYNTKMDIAFSDRLIEYLLLGVICSGEGISGNIERVQEVLSNIDIDYANRLASKHAVYGVWDDGIQDAIARLIEKYHKETNLVDMDDNINKDIEQLLKREEASY